MNRGVRVLSALAVLVALAITGCRSQEETPTAATESSGSGTREGMRGVSLQNFKVGDTKWVLHADSASVFRERKRVEARQVQVDFFDGEEPVSTMTAELAILIQKTDDLEARGNVQVVAEDGSILKTEVLYWNHQQSKIHTDQYVEITKGEDVLTGVGLEADPGLDRIDLKQDVSGTTFGNPTELLEEEDS